MGGTSWNSRIWEGCTQLLLGFENRKEIITRPEAKRFPSFTQVVIARSLFGSGLDNPGNRPWHICYTFWEGKDECRTNVTLLSRMENILECAPCDQQIKLLLLNTNWNKRQLIGFGSPKIFFFMFFLVTS